MNPAANYILEKPEPYRSILLHLQAVIEHTVPEAKLLFKWRLPCYYIGKKPLCYLNCTKDYVDLGFWNAAHLTKYTECMVAEGRKVIKSLRYFSLDEIDQKILVEVLKEAYELRDRKFYK